MSDVKMGGPHQAYFNQLEMLMVRAEQAEVERDKLRAAFRELCKPFVPLGIREEVQSVLRRHGIDLEAK